MSTSSPQDVYDRLGERYDRWTKGLDRVLLDRMRGRLLRNARGRVLEVAIGTGKNLLYYPDDCEVAGVDVSAEMLRVAEKRARDAGRRFDGAVCDAGRMPYPDELFDTVVCTLAACTFTDPVPVLREMARVCRSDGRTLFLEHVRPTSPLGARFFDGLSRLTVPLLGCHPNRDTVASIEAAGLRIAEREEGFGGIVLSMVAARV